MLKDLTYREDNIHPSFICGNIAMINGVDLGRPSDYFQHYCEGVYRHDGYKFNSDRFITERCKENILDEWVEYGVCDNYKQVLRKYKDLLSDPSKNFVIMLSTVNRKDQSCQGGWRWHKWGEYIGTQNPQHEYLYDDTHIDRVYCFHIYEID